MRAVEIIALVSGGFLALVVAGVVCYTVYLSVKTLVEGVVERDVESIMLGIFVSLLIIATIAFCVAVYIITISN